MDLGVRYDYFDLVDTHVQTSPRVGLAYHIAPTKTVLRAAYNRYFSPPPIEYSLLASFIGHNAINPAQRVGNVRAYTQNYFEVGLAQELHPRVSLEINAYLHTGHNPFENHEISITRIFVPINFHTARSHGVELVVNMKQLERLGITGRFQYALSRTYFYGPNTGGFAGDVLLGPGEIVIPAFDQTHTGTAQVFVPNPVQSLGAESLTDQKDSDAAVPAAAYYRVTLTNLDWQFSIAQLPPEALLVPGRYFSKTASLLHRARHDPHLNPLPQGEERKHSIRAAGELPRAVIRND